MGRKTPAASPATVMNRDSGDSPDLRASVCPRDLSTISRPSSPASLRAASHPRDRSRRLPDGSERTMKGSTGILRGTDRGGEERLTSRRDDSRVTPIRSDSMRPIDVARSVDPPRMGVPHLRHDRRGRRARAFRLGRRGPPLRRRVPLPRAGGTPTSSSGSTGRTTSPS
jgi:hypothetical protein